MRKKIVPVTPEPEKFEGKRGRKPLEVCLGFLPDSPPDVLEDEGSRSAYLVFLDYLRPDPKIQPSDLEIVVIAARQKARLDQLSREVAKLKKSEVVTNEDGAYPKCNPLYAEIRTLEKDYRSTLRELNLTPAARAAKRQPLSEREQAHVGQASAKAAIKKADPAMVRLFGKRAN